MIKIKLLYAYVKKTYVALLDGIVNESEGTINLPLRVDLDDRPKQVVCYEQGKNAITNFKVLEIKDKKKLESNFIQSQVARTNFVFTLPIIWG